MQAGWPAGAFGSIRSVDILRGRVRHFIIAGAWVLVFGTAWATAASPAPFQIILESVAPYYLPESAYVAPGTEIQWHNPTGSAHTITHDGCSMGGRCMFDSGHLPPDQTYSVPGLPPGQYPYHCEVHPIMRGVVIVTSPASLPQQT